MRKNNSIIGTTHVRLGIFLLPFPTFPSFLFKGTSLWFQPLVINKLLEHFGPAGVSSLNFIDFAFDLFLPKIRRKGLMKTLVFMDVNR